MSQHFDVLVIGGGIVGLTAALAMATTPLYCCCYRCRDIDGQYRQE